MEYIQQMTSVTDNELAAVIKTTATGRAAAALPSSSSRHQRRRAGPPCTQCQASMSLASPGDKRKIHYEWKQHSVTRTLLHTHLRQPWRPPTTFLGQSWKSPTTCLGKAPQQPHAHHPNSVSMPVLERPLSTTSCHIVPRRHSAI